MPEKDVTRINISDFAVGVVGLKRVMEELAETHAAKADEEIHTAMLQRLEKDNYIPSGARDSYGKAFVREFRKFLGQPYTEDTPKGLDIKVLGSGCAQCEHLTRLVMDVLTEIGLSGSVEHVTDMREIAKYGIMGVPALLINGKVVATGSVPPRHRVAKWLSEAGAALGVKV